MGQVPDVHNELLGVLFDVQWRGGHTGALQTSFVLMKEQGNGNKLSIDGKKSRGGRVVTLQNQKVK